MYIIWLNSMIENSWEFILKNIFSNNKKYINVYFSDEFSLQVEDIRINKIIENNHSAHFEKWFLKMINDVINESRVIQDEFNKYLNNKFLFTFNKYNLDFNNFKSIIWNISKDRNSLWHNFQKMFQNQNKDYHHSYNKDIQFLKDWIIMIYEILLEEYR